MKNRGSTMTYIKKISVMLSLLFDWRAALVTGVLLFAGAMNATGQFPDSVVVNNSFGDRTIWPHLDARGADSVHEKTEPVHARLMWNGIPSTRDRADVESRCGVTIANYIGNSNGCYMYALFCPNGGESAYNCVRSDTLFTGKFYNLTTITAYDKGTPKILGYEPFGVGEIDERTGMAWASIALLRDVDTIAADSMVRSVVDSVAYSTVHARQFIVKSQPSSLAAICVHDWVFRVTEMDTIIIAVDERGRTTAKSAVRDKFEGKTTCCFDAQGRKIDAPSRQKRRLFPNAIYYFGE